MLHAATCSTLQFTFNHSSRLTYRRVYILTPKHKCMHAHTHAQGKTQKRKIKDVFSPPSPHLCVLHSDSKLQCARRVPVPPLLSVCVSLFLTRSSTCSHRVALVTLCCRELSQTESEGGREGGTRLSSDNRVLPKMMREASNNVFRKKCIRTFHS